MDRFKKHLKEQLGFIEKSCQALDKGEEAEAQRIATHIRTIFHQTKRSTSLLTHLRATNISMLSTTLVGYGPEVGWSPTSLAILSDFLANGSIYYYAPLDKSPKQKSISFSEWWEKEVIAVPGKEKLTRRSLILSVADKDGGAHVDEKLSDSYLAFKSHAGATMIAQSSNGEILELSKESQFFATVRQIGYEVLNSPELLALQN